MCSRRARSDRNEENTLDAFAMQDAIGSGIKKSFPRFAWGCSVLYACAISCTTALLRRGTDLTWIHRVELQWKEAPASPLSRPRTSG
jgi:hypothetical protein